MGIEIYIGERDGGRVASASHPDAPTWPTVWPDRTWKSNCRSMRYSVAYHWSMAVGLYTLFDGDGEREGIFGSDGDTLRPITREHLAEITAARERWQLKYPGGKPGWGEDDDHYLARLIWFEWWFKWALDNCKNPSIWNQ